MQAEIARQFGMKGCEEDVVLPAEHWHAFVLREHCHARTDALDLRRPDEHTPEATAEKVTHRQIGRRAPVPRARLG